MSLKFRPRVQGFTLIEILIVVSIIAILMSLIVAGIQVARKKASETIAQNFVNALAQGLDHFYQDEGHFPGAEYADDENALPALYEALLGEKKPKGKGGRSAPYVDVKKENVRVFDQNQNEYRLPTFDEEGDPEVPKFITDPWGEPFWYRVNKGKERAEFRHNMHKTDIWSTGADRKNHNLPDKPEGAEEKPDDLGNW